MGSLWPIFGAMFIFFLYFQMFLKLLKQGGGVSVVMLDHRNGDSTETVGLFNRSSWMTQLNFFGWFSQNSAIIQLKILDNLAEAHGQFSWNSWMIQLKLLDDSAEALGRFSWSSWTIQLKLLDDSAEWTIHLILLDHPPETLGWFSWKVWAIQLKLMENVAETHGL